MSIGYDNATNVLCFDSAGNVLKPGDRITPICYIVGYQRQRGTRSS